MCQIDAPRILQRAFSAKPASALVCLAWVLSAVTGCDAACNDWQDRVDKTIELYETSYSHFDTTPHDLEILDEIRNCPPPDSPVFRRVTVRVGPEDSAQSVGDNSVPPMVLNVQWFADGAVVESVRVRSGTEARTIPISRTTRRIHQEEAELIVSFNEIFVVAADDKNKHALLKSLWQDGGDVALLDAAGEVLVLSDEIKQARESDTVQTPSSEP